MSQGMQMVPNDAIRRRYLVCSDHYGTTRVAQHLLAGLEWSADSEWATVRTIEVALGLQRDRYGNIRNLIRRYRLGQFERLLGEIESGIFEREVIGA